MITQREVASLQRIREVSKISHASLSQINDADYNVHTYEFTHVSLADRGSKLDYKFRV